MDKLNTLHSLHRNNPLDLDKRAEFLSASCEYFIKYSTHVFHNNPELIVELLAIFSLDQGNPLIQSVLNKLSLELEYCLKCVDVYYKAKELFKIRYSSLYSQSITKFTEIMFEWDKQRILISLNSLLNNADSLLNANMMSCTFYQLMAYPQTLKFKQVDEAFSHLVKEISGMNFIFPWNHQNVLLPGFIISIIHNEKHVAAWAYKIIKSVKFKMDFKFIKESKEIIDYIISKGTGAHHEFNLSRHLPTIAFSLQYIISILDKDSLMKFVNLKPDLIQSLINGLHSESSDFWIYLQCIHLLFKFEIIHKSNCRDIFLFTVQNHQYHIALKDPSSEDRILFDWIHFLLLKDPQIISNLLILRGTLNDMYPVRLKYLDQIFVSVCGKQLDERLTEEICMHYLEKMSELPTEYSVILLQKCLLFYVNSIYDRYYSTELKLDTPFPIKVDHASEIWSKCILHSRSSYQYVAIRAYSEICLLSLNDSEEISSLLHKIETSVISAMRSIVNQDPETINKFLLYFGENSILLLFAPNKSVYELTSSIFTREKSMHNLFREMILKNSAPFLKVSSSALSIFNDISASKIQNSSMKIVGTDFLSRIILVIDSLFDSIFGLESTAPKLVLGYRELFIKTICAILKHIEIMSINKFAKSSELKQLLMDVFSCVSKFLTILSQNNQLAVTFFIAASLKWLLIENKEVKAKIYRLISEILHKFTFPKGDLQKLLYIAQKIFEKKTLSEEENRALKHIFLQKIEQEELAISKPISQSSVENISDNKMKNITNSNILKEAADKKLWIQLAEKSLKRPISMTERERNIKAPKLGNSALMQQLKNDQKIEQLGRKIEKGFIARDIRPTVSTTVLEEGTSFPLKSAAPSESRSNAQNTNSIKGQMPKLSTVKKVAPIDTPVKPKRSTIMITAPEINVARKGKPIGIPGADKKRRILDINNFFKEILSWEYSNISSFQPRSKSELLKISNEFASYADYAKTFEPFLLFECWAQFSKAVEERSSKDLVMCFVLGETACVNDIHEVSFNCSSSVMGQGDVSENDIIILSSFGEMITAQIKSIINTNGRDSLLKCTLNLSKKMHMVGKLSPNSKWDAFKLFSLTPALREYQALQRLEDFFLCRFIIRPSFVQKIITQYTEIRMMQERLKVNDPQAQAIVAAVKQKEGFVLIQGPPGTGKTQTILGIIGAQLRVSTPILAPQRDRHEPSSIKRTKLMCCAPSNAAVDEIARRLMCGILDSKGKLFVPKIVRLGTSAVHPSVKSVTLDSLVEISIQEAKSDIRDSRDIQTIERDLILKQINELKDAKLLIVEGSKSNIQINDINRQLKEKYNSLDKIRIQKDSGSFEFEKRKREIRASVVAEADIILCTLSGSGHESLAEIKNTEFPVVIIDEACQCIEASNLIPLQYGAKKCILVGDPNQLPPTVLSPIAKEYHFEESLFQRIMKASPESVHLLSIQYRMHPSICEFPSAYFYKSALKNGPNLGNTLQAPWHNHSSKLFPPFIFYDVDTSREENVKFSVCNRMEARMCVKLVKLLAAYHPLVNFHLKIGVITFYKHQVRVIKDLLITQFGRSILQSIDVNTVDGFQGQEKDIIILSCVRTSGLGFITDFRRMNVALTRAKKTLIILGKEKTLVKSEEWNALIENAYKRNMYYRLEETELDGLMDAGTKFNNLFEE